MNKKIILGLILTLSLSLAACGKKEEKVVENNTPDKGLEIFEKQSLLDWLKGGKVVECTIKSPEGNIVVKTKNEAVRMEGVPYFSTNSSGEMLEAGDGVMLTVGDWTYTWDKVTKKGTKMNMKELEKIAPEEDESEPEEWDDMAEEWDDSGFEYDCKEIKADDALFEEPSDVDFQDLNEMMSGMTEMSDKLQEQAENGEEMDMEELEKMMQGF